MLTTIGMRALSGEFFNLAIYTEFANLNSQIKSLAKGFPLYGKKFF
jgi:hypothetical protein